MRPRDAHASGSDAAEARVTRLPVKTGRSSQSILAEVGATLVSSLVLEEVLATVARQIGEALDVWSVDVHDFSRERDLLTYEAFWSCGETTQEDLDYVGTVVRLSERPDWRRVLEGEIVEWHIDDPDLPAEERAAMEQWGYKTTLDAPLLHGDNVIGVLGVVETRFVRRFTAAERGLFGQLCVMAAIAINNAKMYRRQERQNRQLTSLLDSSRAVSSTLVVEDVLTIVAQKATEAVGIPQADIFEYDPEAQTMTWRATYPAEIDRPEGTDALGTVYPVEGYPGNPAVLSDARPLVETISDPAIHPNTRAGMLAWGEKTALTVPLIFGGQVLGTLELLETRYERRFTDDEIELARGVAERAAVAMHNAHMYRRQEEQNQRLLALVETSRSIASSLDFAEIAARVKAEVARVFGGAAGDVTIRLRTDEGEYLPVSQWLDESSRETPPVPGEVELDELARGAIASLKPAQSDPADGLPELVVPFAARGDAIGFVSVQSGLEHPFEEADIELLQIVANQAAVAIENVRLYQTIKHQAITDGLTGLYNHRYFYERLGEEVARARRYDLPLSLLMVDLDDFKRCNDRFGHPRGDDVLRQVGEAISNGVRRDIDLAARYGGEEFAIILPSTPNVDGGEDGPAGAAGQNGAEVVAERLRCGISGCDVAGAGSGSPLCVTASIGVATLSGRSMTVDALVGAADKALYLAKRLGKDRVERFR